MAVLMTPDMANFSGKVEGGALLNLLDRVAFSCASRYSQEYAVTLPVDQVVFRQPIHVAELVTFLASINHAGRTSMEVGIRVEAENIRTGERRHTNSCYFTMVAVDAEGHPTAVPPYSPVTACLVDACADAMQTAPRPESGQSLRPAVMRLGHPFGQEKPPAKVRHDLDRRLLASAAISQNLRLRFALNV
ncbi:acyl-CoA thioesterase [Ensifer adhaerens]|uniref:acyl-CoA thioesterase n=1 Tax=Ensifer adhaerens TaxID=106592 RepID=UPI003CFDB078